MGAHHQAGGQRGEYYFLSALTSTIIFSPPTVTATQIVFKSRLGAHDVGSNCLMLIDDTNFCILQKGAATRGNAFGSQKYVGKSVLRYGLGIDILAGNLSFYAIALVSVSAIWSLVLRKDLDESLAHVFTKTMIAYIDVLSPRTYLWKPS